MCELLFVLLCEDFDGAVEIHDGDVECLGIRSAFSPFFLRKGLQVLQNHLQFFSNLSGGRLLHGKGRSILIRYQRGGS